MNRVPGGRRPRDDELEELVAVQGPLRKERDGEDGVAVVQLQRLVQQVNLVLERPAGLPDMRWSAAW